MKKVSIIIPHFNTPHSLKKLLETIPDIETLEVIVVDDNSNKDIEMLSRLIKKVKKIKTKLTFKFYTNNSGVKGAGASRNIGLSHATGEWILFADSDDYFELNFYDKISKYFDSAADLVIFTPISRDDTNAISDRHVVRKKLIDDCIENNIRENLIKLKYKFPEPWSKLYRRELIDNNNIEFQETLVANDVLFSAKVGVASEKVIVSDEVIYCVIKREGSLTTTLSDENFLTRVKVFSDRYKFLEKNLSNKDFEILNLSGTNYIFSVFTTGYSIKTKKKVLKMLKESDIKLFSKETVIDYINPIKRIKSYKYNKKFINKRYLSR